MPHLFTQQPCKPQEYRVAGWVLAGGRCPKPLRVVLRSGALILWIFACWTAMRAIQLATIGKPGKRKHWAKRLSRRWIRTMRGLFGIRVFGVGQIPEPPFFLVINHHTWVGYFGINDL